MPANSQGAATVAIIGAGFSGTAVAIQLLRRVAAETLARPLHVILVEPRPEMGAGVAYATRDYPYPLNVAAGQMSLDAAAPDDFIQFARAQGICAEGCDYLPHPVYGAHLRARLDSTNARSA